MFFHWNRGRALLQSGFFCASVFSNMSKTYCESHLFKVLGYVSGSRGAWIGDHVVDKCFALGSSGFETKEIVLSCKFRGPETKVVT